MLKKSPNLSLHILINAMLIKKNMYMKQFCCFAQASEYRCRLCTWINKRGVWNKTGDWLNSSKLINGECWIRLGRVAKNEIINKRGVPSIRNSRVFKRDSYTQITFSKNWSSRWQTSILCDGSISYSPFNLS